jgi:hypothetical protein
MWGRFGSDCVARRRSVCCTSRLPPSGPRDCGGPVERATFSDGHRLPAPHRGRIRVIRHYWLAFGQRARKSTAGCLMR